MISAKTLAGWVEEFNEGYAPADYTLEDWLEECIDEMHKQQELDAYYGEPDPETMYGWRMQDMIDMRRREC